MESTGSIVDQINENKAFMQDLYENYAGLIYYYLIKNHVPGEEQEDVVQDVLLRLIRNVLTLRCLTKPQLIRYIVLTIHATLIDKGRKATVREIPMECEDIERLKMDGQGDGMEVEAKWDIEKVRSTLPQREWELLEGKYFLGYSQEELGERFGCSPDSVRMILSRARKKARAILKGKD